MNNNQTMGNPGRTIACKDLRPSLTMDEADIRTMIDRIEAIDGKEGLVTFAVDLCENYDLHFENGEDVAYQALEDLEIALGERRLYSEAAKKKEIEDDTEKERGLFEAYREWRDEDERPTPNRFFEVSGGDYNKFDMCRTKFLKVLKEYEQKKKEQEDRQKREDASVIELGHSFDFPFLLEYEPPILKRFLFTISIAFLNLTLPETIDTFTERVETRQKAHKKSQDLEGFSLFLDLKPKMEFKDEISTKEQAQSILWGRR